MCALDAWTHELRLCLTLLLNAGVFGSAYWFARRRADAGSLQAACDAMLIGFVVQYVAVALPGVLGILSLWSMSMVAFAAMALLIGLSFLRAQRETDEQSLIASPPARSASALGLIACTLFTIGYLISHAYDQRWLPPLATDAIVYHVPTAVEWMQTGRLGLHPAWYWNPAATYSPATSSTFMAWLMLPTGNDLFVRFAQVPPLVMIFLLSARLARLLGCPRGVAGLVAAAAALSRPYLAEAIFPKDDLFVTAFFGAAVVSLAPVKVRGRLGAVRVGLAFGMVLASKYTVLLACPLFLFMADAPFRARRGWRWWGIALGIGLTLSMPWYVRNVVLTGNPLYPVDVRLLGLRLFNGMFGTERDQELRTAGGTWRMLNETYHSLPLALIFPLLLGWLGALLSGLPRDRLRPLRDPLLRACTLGTAITLGIFLITSPHREVRYLFPLFFMVFAATAAAIARWLSFNRTPDRPFESGVGGGLPRDRKVADTGPSGNRLHYANSEGARLVASLPAVGAGMALLAVALLTGFEAKMIGRAAGLAVPAFAIAIVGTASCALWMRFRLIATPAFVIAGLFGGLGVGLWGYVNWKSYVGEYYLRGTGQPEGIPSAWAIQYPQQAALWAYVREGIPDDAVIAVANTVYRYPFYDADYRRRLDYAPVRPGFGDYVRLPRLGDTVPGDLIAPRLTAMMNEGADRATWLANLKRMGATHLIIGELDMEPNPPERRFVRETPERFEKLFEGPSGAVYKVFGQ